MKNSAGSGRRLLPVASIASLAVAAALVLGPALLSCDPGDDERRREEIEAMYQDYKKRSFPEVIDVEPRLAMDLARRSEVVIVDVRTPEEQQVSMIPGAVSEKQFLRDLEQHKDRLVIGYCTISYRSGEFARKLRAEHGITMYNLRGGLLAWVHDGGDIVDQKGKTRRIHVYGRKWNLAPKAFEAIW